jgi:type I restriction enzyme, S subunit
MSASWPNVTLGDVLRRSEHIIPLDPEATYKEVTVRINGKGVVERRQVQGIEIAADRRYQVKSGQFIISRIDARHGASGLIPDELDGAVVTNDFPLFDVAEGRLDAGFLGWMSKTASFVELCKRASEGTTNRVRLSEARFKALSISLPAVDEQRRIVARIEQLATKVEEARACRAKATDLRDGFVESFIGQRFAELEFIYPARTFGSCGAHVSSGPRNWGKNYTSSGLRFYRAQDIDRSFQISDENVVYVERPPGSQGQSAIVSDGDLLIVITGATVGRAAVYDNNQSPGLVSQHVAVCRIPSASFLPRFVLWGLRGPHGQKQLLGSKYGQGKPGLNLGQVRGLSLPCPPIDVQVKISGELDALQSKVDSVKALHRETAAELDAMLPAILDRAFKGEL